MKAKFLEYTSSFMPFRRLQKWVDYPVVPLFYHAVGNISEMSYLKGLYNVIDARKFSEQIDFLLKHYVPIDLKCALRYYMEGVLPGKGPFFFLSFDDGLKVCKEIIAPVLKSKGVPATFFVNTSFVDNTNFLHRFKTNLISQQIRKDETGELNKILEKLNGTSYSRKEAAEYVHSLRYNKRDEIGIIEKAMGLDTEKELRSHAPYMDRNDIQELIDEGFTIGAHSAEHPEYYLLSEEEQLQQTISSMKKIVEWFSVDYKVFAFPFTDVGVKKSFFEKLNERCKPDLTFGCSGLKTDPVITNIHRIPLDDTFRDIHARLKSEMVHYILKKQFGFHIFRR